MEINYKIEWNQEKMILVCRELEKWMKKRGDVAYIGERIMQDDDCQIYAAELIANIVDDILKPEYIENNRRRADYVLDWNLDSASLYLHENEIEYRISKKDGELYILTQDFRPERANLEIEKGKIVKITYG